MKTITQWTFDRIRGAAAMLPLAVLISCFLLCGAVTAPAVPPHVPGRILVKPKPQVSDAALRGVFQAHRAREVAAIQQINVRVLRVPENRVPAVLDRLQHNPHFEYAELDYLVEPAVVPNDTYYSLEWHLPKMGAPAAWDITTGSSSVIIAILDSGVDATHPELAPLLVPGWNFYDNNANTSDVTGHGTGVAGQACAAGNNGVGIAAPAWACKIMPIRIADAYGYTSDSMIAAGLTYAADHGARVANASFAIQGSSSTLSSAAQYFQSKGGVVTGSAGNDATFDSTPDDPYILRISAADSSDLLASFSSTGNNIDLCAPGVNIVTTTKGGGYGYGTGTSASAPLVAGVAALMISVNPNLTASQVQQILKESADDLGAPGWDSSFGWGRINAARAVQAAASASTSDTTAPTASITAPAAGATVSGVVTVNVSASDNVAVTRVDFYVNNALAGTTSTTPASFAWDTRALSDGAYNLVAKAYDTAGNVGPSPTVTVSVQNTPRDTVPPAAAITAPVAGAVVSGAVEVAVAASDDTGVAQVALSANGRLLGTSQTAPASFHWDTTTVSNGSWTLQAMATDAAGNSGTSQVVVQVNNADTTPPAVRITSPSSGITVGKSTKVSVTASDNVGVTKVQLLIDGKLLATSTQATTTFTWNTSKLSKGSHYVQAQAFDAAGNSTRSTAVTVYK